MPLLHLQGREAATDIMLSTVPVGWGPLLVWLPLVLSFLWWKRRKKVWLDPWKKKSSFPFCFASGSYVHQPRQTQSSVMTKSGPLKLSWGQSQSSLLVSVPLLFFAFSELFFHLEFEDESKLVKDRMGKFLVPYSSTIIFSWFHNTEKMITSLCSSWPLFFLPPLTVIFLNF